VKVSWCFPKHCSCQFHCERICRGYLMALIWNWQWAGHGKWRLGKGRPCYQPTGEHSPGLWQSFLGTQRVIMTRSGEKTCRWKIWKGVSKRLSHKLEIKKEGGKIVSLSDRESSFGLLIWHAAVVSPQGTSAYKLLCSHGTTHISQTGTRSPLDSLSTLEAPDRIASIHWWPNTLRRWNTSTLTQWSL